MKHALRCLLWGWRRRAATIEAKVRQAGSFSERAIGEAQGFARGLRFCASAAARAIARAERKAGK